MIQTVRTLWNIARPLSILIFLFSVVWPYAKLLLTAYLWSSPRSDRTALFKTLDSLGKWSIFDVFALIITIVVFRLQVHAPGALGKDIYDLDAMVVPVWGLHANHLAQIVAQLLSHYVLFWSEKADEVPADASRVPLARRALFANKGGELVEHRLRPGIPLLLSCGAGLGAVLLVLGAVLPNFQTTLHGTLAVASNFQSLDLFSLDASSVDSSFLDASSTQSYNLFSVLALLTQQARKLNHPMHTLGIALLEITFLSTTLLVPLLILALSLSSLFLPPRPSPLRHLHSWQFLPVYLLSLFVATFQTGKISESLFASACPSSSPFFGGDTCFRVDTGLTAGFFVLLAGYILFLGVACFARELARLASGEEGHFAGVLGWALVECPGKKATGELEFVVSIPVE